MSVNAIHRPALPGIVHTGRSAIKRADQVQLPVKFEMAVNAKTAKALGLAVPQSILSRADEVIE
jgi:ABC-type uncharacterized transport system substrate-binding protein